MSAAATQGGCGGGDEGGSAPDAGACDPLQCQVPEVPDGGAACSLPFVGDPCLPMEIELLYYGVDQLNHAVEPGGEIPLICPPQGGRVMFIGVRVKNVDPCGVSITGALRDTDSNAVRVEQRIVNLSLTQDGWAETDISNIANFANVPVCPNQWTDKTIYSEDFGLEAVVQDRCGRKGSAKETVRPACSEAGHAGECHCMCKGGYVLGEPCPEAQGEVPCGETFGAGGAGGGP